MKGLRSLGCLLVLLLAAVVLFPAKAEAADAAINKANFPDSGFRAYVKSEFDTNKDGILSAKEAAAVREISYYSMGCTSMKGAEYFTNLKVLCVDNNQLTELDLSPFPYIYQVWCNGNQIKELDIHLNKYLVKAVTEWDGELDAADKDILYTCWDTEETDDDFDECFALWVDRTTKVATARPSVKTQPKALTVKAGDKASFKVTAKGGGH